MCRVRVEDHRLLAHLHLAVLEAANTVIHVEDRAGSGLLGIDEPEGTRDRAFPEQALAGAENHWELPDAQAVDEIMLEQGLEELAAAVDLDLATFLGL